MTPFASSSASVTPDRAIIPAISFSMSRMGEMKYALRISRSIPAWRLKYAPMLLAIRVIRPPPVSPSAASRISAPVSQGVKVR